MKNTIKKQETYVKYAEFLCKDDENLKLLFQNYIFDSQNPMYSVNELRKYVRFSDKRGMNITSNDIDKEINKNNFLNILKYMEELFLEPISTTYIVEIENMIHCGIKGEHIMKWRKSNKRPISLLNNPQKGLK